ncbi:peptidoglycan-binding protein [Anaerobiospirillum sp. NML120448]|uniref:peptidoglycan-binding domain-containing protein n=1 Tax=Anaerobiospirillum sp. NML120448 TaxID=2932816 RepID=UPI001FF409EC|nr:peptidoglycan-binding domain-containing protein [Anaerobiospirillum sp. NML120448]MCK0513858.1 peptidoglycan-binding protein [Anaerobiospirillum sp. NML120448]
MKNIRLFLFSIICWNIIFSGYTLANNSDLSFYETKYAGMGKYSVEELMTFDDSDVRNNTRLLNYEEAQKCDDYIQYANIRGLVFQHLISFTIVPEKTCPGTVDYDFFSKSESLYSFLPVKNDFKLCENANYPSKYFNLFTTKYFSVDSGSLDLLKKYFKQSDDLIAYEPNIILDKSKVKEAQEILNKLGYKAGNADGIMGLKTSKAIVAFSKSVDLLANKMAFAGASRGLINDHVLNALRQCIDQRKSNVDVLAQKNALDVANRELINDRISNVSIKCINPNKCYIEVSSKENASDEDTRRELINEHALDAFSALNALNDLKHCIDQNKCYVEVSSKENALDVASRELINDRISNASINCINLNKCYIDLSSKENSSDGDNSQELINNAILNLLR